VSFAEAKERAQRERAFAPAASSTQRTTSQKLGARPRLLFDDCGGRM
jgi:hypothetical protein